jgi:hypothetical protein
MTRHPTANASQRARRARLPRIDYEPAPECLAIIRANLGRSYPDCILSGVIDRIVREWAEDRGQWTGIKYSLFSKPMTTAAGPEFPYAMARADESGVAAGVSASTTRARDFGKPAGVSGPVRAPARKACGARTKAGTPCQSKPLPGKTRCKWHGGASTGPTSNEGKRTALANLRQFKARA